MRKKTTVGLRSLALALALAVALVLGPAGPASATTITDVAMRVSPSGAWVGVAVTSDDGTGETLEAKIARGFSETFDVCAENQSGVLTGVTVSSKGDRGSLTATWRDALDSHVVTDEEIEAGYPRLIAAGQSLCMTVKIKVKKDAIPHKHKSWPITGSSTPSVDDTGVIRITIKK